MSNDDKHPNKVFEFIEFLTIMRNLSKSDINKSDLEGLLQFQRLMYKNNEVEIIIKKLLQEFELCLSTQSTNDFPRILFNDIHSEYLKTLSENCLKIIINRIKGEIDYRISKRDYNFAHSNVEYQISALNDYVNSCKEVTDNAQIIFNFAESLLNSIVRTSSTLNMNKQNEYIEKIILSICFNSIISSKIINNLLEKILVLCQYLKLTDMTSVLVNNCYDLEASFFFLSILKSILHAMKTFPSQGGSQESNHSTISDVRKWKLQLKQAANAIINMNECYLIRSMIKQSMLILDTL